MVWQIPWKQMQCRMTEPPGFSNRQLISTIGLDNFHSESRVIYQNIYSGTKSFNIMTEWSSWGWWTIVSLVIRCQMGPIVARLQIECHCVRERNNKNFESHFGISNNQTTELQGIHLPLPVDLVSRMCDIESTEFDSDWRVNNLFNIIMTC
jgi:hypothetical protein